MAKDTFYFSHDYNARNDAKIKKLISKHGFLGYGIFWAIIEDLYNNTNVLPTDYESIAFDLRTDHDTILSIINDFDLFVFDGKNFGSLSIQKRIDERNEKSKKARESVLKRWKNKEIDTNVLPTNNDSNTIKERKVKENKVNESKVELTHKIQILVNSLKNVSKLKDQLTFENCTELEKKYPYELIIEKLNAMENKVDLQKKYFSVYRTLDNWCKDSLKTKSGHSFQTPKTYTDKW